MKLKTLFYVSLITFVASLVPAAQAQTFSTIYAFSGDTGIWPQAGVTLRAGVLYGTTLDTEFATGNGTVYQLSRAGSNWTHTVISFFSGIPYGGESPAARVVFGPDNHLYGTTLNAGPFVWERLCSDPTGVDLQDGKLLFERRTVLYQFEGNGLSGWAWSDAIWDTTGEYLRHLRISEELQPGFGAVYEMSHRGTVGRRRLFTVSKRTCVRRKLGLKPA